MNSRSLRRLGVLVAVLLGMTSLSACAASPPASEVAAGVFLQALASGDVGAAAAATDQPEQARATIASARDALKPESLTTQLQRVRTSGDTATADFSVSWTLPQARVWSYSGVLNLGRTKGAWSVRWSTADLHPKLAANQALALRVDRPPTAAVLDRGGDPVLTSGVVVDIVLNPAEVGDLDAVANSLSGPLARFDPAITAQSIGAGVARHGKDVPYSVATLRESDYQSIKSAVYSLPGLSFSAQARLLPADPAFAPAVMRQVGRSVDNDLAGKAGWRIVTVSPNGAQIDTLATTAPVPAPAVRLTLDRGVQGAAQAAVNEQSKPAVTVALKASTGEILAVAQNPLADGSGAIALSGLYPAGSTFKIATAAAALQAGITTAETPSACPASTVINGERLIPNYNDFALGTVPLRSAFAASCNTTFAQLSTTLSADSLTAAAAQLGVGRDYVVDGVTTITGQIPPAGDVVKRAEDAIGQGDVQVSPFGMSLMAASVAHGSTPTPVLIQGTPTKVDAPPAAVPQPALDQLRLMMREVVTGGSAIGVDQLGAVFGKTGEAQFGDGSNSHSWFVGYRGDVAFASLIVGGGSSGYAVGMAGRFLRALPPDY